MWRLKRRQTFFSCKRRAVLTPSVAATLRDQYYKPLSPPWVEALKELPIARTYLLHLPPTYTNYPLHLPMTPYIYQRPPTSTKGPLHLPKTPTSTNGPLHLPTTPYVYQLPPTYTNYPLHLPSTSTKFIYQLSCTQANYQLHIRPILNCSPIFTNVHPYNSFCLMLGISL